VKYWWVNQSGSHKVEHAGSFMWSPRHESNGRINHAYENMKILVPGDRIFSNVDGHITAIGTIQSSFYPCSRPEEFPVEQNKGNIEGWRVNVTYNSNFDKFKHLNYESTIRPLLPSKYSPIDINGKAAMKLYLTSISDTLASELMKLIGITDESFPDVNVEVLNESQVSLINKDQSLTSTEKRSLILSRIGQGKFREKVLLLEPRCRVTGIDDPRFLIASHIKPWRDCNNFERLDGSNGLMLSPTIDKLFDGYYISFSDDGFLLISSQISQDLRMKFQLDSKKHFGNFTHTQLQYLKIHRSKLK